jgi:flagellar L-ring protein FlgH
MRYVSILLLCLSVFGSVGCASFGQKWKALISGKSDVDQQAEAQRLAKSTTYSDQSNLVPNTYRKYRRTTKKDIQDESKLDSNAGSLWVMEGQGAYLFAQNVVRMIGDPIGIRIEGDPRDQLSQKSQVIGDLLKQLEDRRRRAMQRQASDTTAKPDAEAQKAEAEKAAGKTDPLAALANPTTVGRGPAATNEKDFSVKTVPTRIVERLVDGNYRVRGTQPFMIGNREYRVIVSGIVRAEDFNDEGISATQLLDPNFDIVSSKSTEIR